MRRHRFAAGILVAAASVAGGATAASAAPPDSDAAADEASARFDDFLADEGYDVVAPVCVEADEAMTFICYALTTDGEAVVAQTSVDSDVVEWDVLVRPGADAASVAEETEPEEIEPESSDAESTEAGSIEAESTEAGSIEAESTEPDTTTVDTTEADASEPDTTAVDTTEADASEPGSTTAAFDALPFFQAVFSADADQIDGVVEQTEPGSPAEAYVRFQNQFVAVSAGFGNEVARGEVTPTDDGVEVCVTPTTCTEITDIEVSEGQIVTFTVDGNAIDSRLSTTGEPVVAGTAALRLDVAYQTVTGGQLAAFVEVATEQGDRIDLAGATYIGEDGTEQAVAPQLSLGLDIVKLKGNHMALLAFPGAAPGGEIHIPVTPSDGSAPVVAVIPVEALAP